MNEKMQKYLEELALRWSPFGMVWDSSAKKLEQDLSKRGINLKLYYRYALPENMSPQEFMVKIAVLDLCENASVPLYIKKDIFFDKNLSLIEKLRLVKYIASKRTESRRKIDEYVKFIQFANPELSKLKMSKKHHADNILAGAAFGFAPDEIEYFITDYRGMVSGTKDKQVCDKIESYGVRLGYVLAPKTAQKIISELEKNKQSAMMINNGGRKII